jgi:hypothetical protein
MVSTEIPETSHGFHWPADGAPPVPLASTIEISNSRASNDELARSLQLRPTLKLQMDKDMYQPDDPVVVTIEISNPRASEEELARTSWRDWRGKRKKVTRKRKKAKESERNNNKILSRSVNTTTPQVALQCSQIFINA